MQLAGIGRAHFWEGGSVWIALITGVSELHSHHAIQVSLPFQGDVEFKTAAEAAWSHYPGAIIAPDREHAFQAAGRVVANLLFEPESRAGRLLLERMGDQTIQPLTAHQVGKLVRQLAPAYFDDAPDEDMIAICRGLISDLSGIDPRLSAPDVRIQRAIRSIRERLDSPLTLPQLAKSSGLSPGRFRHLFVQETGISFRAFLLWERLNRALALGFGGDSWTEAAHAANFADSAHLTRTCRRIFGFAPTAAKVDTHTGARRQSA